VRGDVLYGFFEPRTQATIDLILFVLFFMPGVFALTYAGYYYRRVLGLSEHSNVTAEGADLSVQDHAALAGAFLLVQGLSRSSAA